MKCSSCASPIEKAMYFALEHEAIDIVREGGSRVYFYVAGGMDVEEYVKIGTSIDVDRRIASFQSGSRGGVVVPEDVLDIRYGELAGVIPGGRRVEKALHHAFRDEHVRGEWFIYSDRIQCILDQLLDEWCRDDCCAPNETQAAYNQIIREAIDGPFLGVTRTLNAGIADYESEPVA